MIGGWSLRTRLTAMVVLLILISTAVLWTVLPNRLATTNEHVFSASSLAATEAIAHTLERKKPAVIVGELEQLVQAPAVRWARVLDAELVPIAAAGNPPHIALQPEAVRLTPNVAVVQASFGLNNRKSLATLQVGWNRSVLDEGVYEHRRVAAGVSALWMVFGLVFAQIAGMLLIAPISRVADAARKVADGDTQVEAMGLRAAFGWRESPDETRRLRAAVVDMATELSQKLEMHRFAVESAEEAERAASEANAMKSSFLANMSHELRTPLNAIIGYSELLSEEAGDLDGGDALVPDLQRVLSSGKHLLGLINDVLDLAKVEAGRMEMLIEPVQVEEAIADALANANPLIRPGVTLVADIHAEELFHTDITRLKQIVYNLLSNAAKFTAEGRIEVRVHRVDEALVLRVRDTGIGMKPEQVARLFQAFVQADTSTTREYGGTGLGLVLVKEFAQRLGGDVDVESQAGVGTTFTVTLREARLSSTSPAVGQRSSSTVET